MSVLREVDVFSKHPGRTHPTFPMNSGLLEQFNVDNFKAWAKTCILKCKLKYKSDS